MPASDNVGVVGYRVFLNNAQVADTPGTSYAVGGLTCGTTYAVAIVAYDAAGNTSDPAVFTATTAPCTPRPAGDASTAGTIPAGGATPPTAPATPAQVSTAPATLAPAPTATATLPATATPAATLTALATHAPIAPAPARAPTTPASRTPAKRSLLTLEGLGSPKISPGCDFYRTRAEGAHLAVGNILFKSGFQLSNVVHPRTTAAGWVEMPCGATANYAWTLTHKHSSFAATLALDASNAAQGPVVRFLDYFNTPIPFRYRGKLIFSLRLEKNTTYPVTLDLTGENSLIISLAHTDRRASIVDVIGDHVS
jgi:hypothetical protein